MEGGADIIDVKEPRHGSLGRAPLSGFREILNLLQQTAPERRISAALGEVSEWCQALSVEQQAWIEFLNENPHPLWLKLGLAGLHHPDQPATIASAEYRRPENDPAGQIAAGAWQEQWLTARQRIGSGSSPHWIAVAYADAERCSAPSLQSVLHHAVHSGCRGLLVDTCLKDGRGLRHWCSLQDLQQLRAATAERGLLLALAGQVRADDLPALLTAAPDIIAVRGAVCAAGQRESSIQPQLVQQLRSALHAAASQPGTGLSVS